MPGRLTPLVTDEFYHVFNRGIDRRPTFTTRREFARAIESIKFYKHTKSPVRLSKFLTLGDEKRKEISQVMENSGSLIEIHSYCLMPNHFHFLLKQKKDKGISKFLSNFQNSYTRYFNTRHGRDGSLFLDQFKAVHIETDEQFVHLSRYIHLNPYSSHVVSTLKDLENYQWSSLKDYIYGKDSFVEKDFIVNWFNPGNNRYKKFVLDYADYQRKLKDIEHLLLE